MKRMKTILSTIGVVVALTVVMSSCSKEDDTTQGNGTISVSATALAGEYSTEDGVKSSLISNIRVSWKAGDKVYAFDGSKYLGELTVSLKNDSDYYAVLSGESLRQPEEGTIKITLIHSNTLTAAPSISEGKITFDIASQTASGSSEDAPFVAYGTIDYNPSSATISGAVVDFSLATSIIRINGTGLEPSTAITGATLKGFSNQCSLQIAQDGTPSIAQGEMGDISLDFASEIDASAAGAIVLYAALAQNTTSSEQAVKMKQSKTYEYDFGSRTRAAARSINSIVQLSEILLPYVVIPAKYDGETVTDLKWYRQNLAISPSGNKSWKGGNSSAVKVPGTGEDVINGDYFQWAAYEGYAQAEGQTVEDRGLLVYESFTSKACGDGSDTFTVKSGKQFNATNAPYYSSSAYAKYTGGEVNLEKSDDVASIILGGNWRLPTAKEFKAMYDATKWTWDATDCGYYVTEKGVSLASDKSNALLFFPAAGFGFYSYFYDVGSNGYYWSSSVYPNNTVNACSLYFISSRVNPQSTNDRFYGSSVRPVSN